MLLLYNKNVINDIFFYFRNPNFENFKIKLALEKKIKDFISFQIQTRVFRIILVMKYLIK